ncbi:zinc-binding dehydrogenase [Pendulispora albinea]|uniref:Alcohol dehydrogenase catalytic domain-containing protein n=1 Tax=Pendulispora albinea TaxID=2741071 RepID=A0ABZ2LT05_9BACT
MTQTMQELTLVAPGQVAFRERAAPRISGPAQALVRPLAVARCDIDLLLAQGKIPAADPFALGHECAGEVIAVGEGVTRVRPGDRVLVPFQISCGACSRCTRGQTGNCTAVPKLASYGMALFSGTEFGGALSDLLLVPYADAMLVALPDEVDPVVAAALGDNAVDGFRTVHAALEQSPGASVLVAGGGAPSVALYAVAAARALGASSVVYVDPSPERGAIAEKLGARVVRAKCEPALRIGRFPITVDGTSREEGLRFCLASTDNDGICTSVGIYLGDVPLPLLDMYSRGVHFVTGRVHARGVLPTALALAARGAFDLASIATTVVPWERAPEAWLEPATKLVVRR